VSERHALIEVRDGGEVVLEDLGSKHGTLVNGAPPTGRVLLHDGDRIRLGHTELVFRSFRPD
jgi:pSer/pThr/pTyr-binding forkhead associated (FHA) protein